MMSGRLLALRFAGVGWYLAFCIVLGVVGGLWLDRKVNTAPLFTLIGTLFGLVVAFYGTYRMVVPLMNDAGSERINKGGKT